MGMKEKSFSLRAIFISYFATVILACTLLAMLILIALNLAYRSGAIIPANNAEQYLIEQKRSLETSKKFDKSDLPNGTTYLFISKSGRVVETDMSQPMEKAILKIFGRRMRVRQVTVIIRSLTVLMEEFWSTTS